MANSTYSSVQRQRPCSGQMARRKCRQNQPALPQAGPMAYNAAHVRQAASQPSSIVNASLPICSHEQPGQVQQQSERTSSLRLGSSIFQGLHSTLSCKWAAGHEGMC